MEHRIRLRVNGQVYEVGVETEVTLLDLVREKLELTGTKAGCRVGECGTCTVLMNGQPVNSCLILAVEADGCEVMTVEGLSGEWSLRTGGRSPSQSIPLVRAVRQRPAETEGDDEPVY